MMRARRAENKGCRRTRCTVRIDSGCATVNGTGTLSAPHQGQRAYAPRPTGRRHDRISPRAQNYSCNLPVRQAPQSSGACSFPEMEFALPERFLRPDAPSIPPCSGGQAHEECAPSLRFGPSGDSPCAWRYAGGVGTGNVFFRFDGRRPRRTGTFQIGKNPGTPARRDMSPPPALAEDERSNESLSVRIKEAGEPAVLSALIQSALP